MFECLSSIKVPSGFSSNIKGIINVPDKKFLNLKSHDCHVLMMQLLPVALRGILPPHVRLATVKLYAFLNAISQKAINSVELATLQRLARAREEADSGVFKPNREKDELTYALENFEHGCRTRGYGAVPWLHTFPADKDTYRSHQRKKDEEADRIHVLEQFVNESRQALLESREREKSRGKNAGSSRGKCS